MSSFNRIAVNRIAVLTALGGTLWAAAPLQFRTRELPRAVAGSSYRATLQTQVDGRCPASDVILEVVGGNLPRGIELSGDTLTGIAKEFGTFQLRLRAANGCAQVVADLALEVTGKPILRVMPEELVFEYHEGDTNPQPQSVLVSASWHDLAYEIRVGSASWLSFHANQGVTPYAGSPYAADPVTIQALPQGLAPGTYRTVLTFSADLGANIPQVPVTFRVLPKIVGPQMDTNGHK